MQSLARPGQRNPEAAAQRRCFALGCVASATNSARRSPTARFSTGISVSLASSLGSFAVSPNIFEPSSRSDQERRVAVEAKSARHPADGPCYAAPGRSVKVNRKVRWSDVAAGPPPRRRAPADHARPTGRCRTGLNTARIEIGKNGHRDEVTRTLPVARTIRAILVCLSPDGFLVQRPASGNLH